MWNGICGMEYVDFGDLEFLIVNENKKIIKKNKKNVESTVIKAKSI